jgi:dTDP-4-amino-4,6-dideoxygalactose transaminase
MSPPSIPWARPFLAEAEVRAVTELLQARRLSMGREVAAFEEETAARVGRRHGLAVANGSVALDVALKLAGIGHGDEVLVSALSYVATTNAIFWQGARPVFCDVEPTTLNVDAADAERRITPRTRAFLVADYCGYPPDYDAIEALCRRHGLVLVVDGAQALGGALHGVPSLARGIVATTSFHTAKAFLTGEGGMVFCDDDGLDERGRRLRGQGEIPGRKYVHDTLAYNYRLTDLAAAIGRAQIARMDEVLGRRRALVERYAERLGEAGVELVEPLDGATISAFSLAMLLPERDRVARQLDAAGIETRSLYPLPAYRQPIPEYAPYAGLCLPNAEAACQRVLNPPLYYELGDADVDRIAGIVTSAVLPSATASRAD